jgi:hypothetical protein
MLRFQQNLGWLLLAALLNVSAAQADEASSRTPLLARLRTIDAPVATISAELPVTAPAVEDSQPSENDFRAELASNVRDISQCSELRQFTDAGDVFISVTVLPSGAIANVSVAANFPQPETALLECIQKAFQNNQLENGPVDPRQFRFRFVFPGPAQISF